MLLNDRLLTNEKDGLSNLLNLTTQDFYVHLVDKKKTKKAIASLQAVRSPSCAHFDLPPLLRPATQARLALAGYQRTIYNKLT